MEKIEKPTVEKLEKLEKQTKDKFILRLISNLKKDLKEGEKDIYNIFSFDRILELIKRETNNKKISKFISERYNKIAYELVIIKKRGKKKSLTLNGEFPLEIVSDMIQKEFDLEPMHLYEFQIGKYKYGSECDEWQEIFDSLDNVKLGAAISAAGLKKGDNFNFLYDFGDRIKFKIEIVNIKRLDLNKILEK